MYLKKTKLYIVYLLFFCTIDYRLFMKWSDSWRYHNNPDKILIDRGFVFYTSPCIHSTSTLVNSIQYFFDKNRKSNDVRMSSSYLNILEGFKYNCSMKLSTEIKELRKKEGLTQQDLSEKSGLSIRTIQRIENNEVNPSVYSLRKIGEVLNRDFELKNYSIMKNILEKKIELTYQ